MQPQGLDPTMGAGAPAADPNRLPPQTAAPPQDGGQQAPPEMQDAYNEFVGRGTAILWSKPVREGLRTALKKSQDAVSTVAEFSASVSLKAIKDAAAEGKIIPAAVTIQGGQEIVQQAGEIAEKAGRPLQQEELEAAYYLAIDRGRAAAQKEGLLDMDAVGADAQQLEGMKQDGRLDQVWAAINATKQRAKAPPLPTPEGV
jgi:hypothetical protein